MVQVDFPIYALSMHKQNRHTGNKKKRLSSQSCHFVKIIFFGVILLHANVQCVYIVYAKYQMGSVKAVDKLISLSTNKTLTKKQSVKKVAILLKSFFFGITLLHANVQCVFIEDAKYKNVSVKAVVQVDFPIYALCMPY